MLVGGCDIGSTTGKAVVMRGGEILSHSILPSTTKPEKTARLAMDEAVEKGRITLMLSSNVKSFTKDSVTIEHEGKVIEIPNNAAIICAGGILPTGFLKDTGINVETKHGTE